MRALGRPMQEARTSKQGNITYDVLKIIFMFSCPSTSRIGVEDLRNLRQLARVSTPTQL